MHLISSDYVIFYFHLETVWTKTSSLTLMILRDLMSLKGSLVTSILIIMLKTMMVSPAM